MSIEDLHDLELVWPSLGPRDVIATGTFDQWSASIHLARSDAGFSGTVKVPWGEKVAYKFIVDGRWRCREDRPQEDDGHGNINNILCTPEKPLPTTPADPPTRLVIPVDGGAHSGDVDNLVTAVEFLTPAETAALPIPHITVEGLTPTSESKLNTAAATEGHGVFLASETPVQHEPAQALEEEQAPASRDAPTTDNGSVPLPLTDGSGEARDLHSISTHAATKGELPTSTEVAKEAVPAASEPAVPGPERTTEVAQDGPAVMGHADVPPAPAPAPASVSVPESKPQSVLADLVPRGLAQATPPAPVSQASTSSTPASSTVTHKKRRSLFARIKQIFEKGHDKQGKKEKHKH